MQMGVNGNFENITWYGPGPQSSYADRHELPINVYAGKVADPNITIIPNRRRVETKWKSVGSALRNKQRHWTPRSRRAETERKCDSLQFADLESVRHLYEIQPTGIIYFNVDLAHEDSGRQLVGTQTAPGLYSGTESLRL